MSASSLSSVSSSSSSTSIQSFSTAKRSCSSSLYTAIPNELLSKILLLSDAKTLCVMTRTCRQICLLIQIGNFWDPIYMRDFCVLPSEFSHAKEKWNQDNRKRLEDIEPYFNELTLFQEVSKKMRKIHASISTSQAPRHLAFCNTIKEINRLLGGFHQSDIEKTFDVRNEAVRSLQIPYGHALYRDCADNDSLFHYNNVMLQKVLPQALEFIPTCRRTLKIGSENEYATMVYTPGRVSAEFSSGKKKYTHAFPAPIEDVVTGSAFFVLDQLGTIHRCSVSSKTEAPSVCLVYENEETTPNTSSETPPRSALGVHKHFCIIVQADPCTVKIIRKSDGIADTFSLSFPASRSEPVSTSNITLSKPPTPVFRNNMIPSVLTNKNGFVVRLQSFEDSGATSEQYEAHFPFVLSRTYWENILIQPSLFQEALKVLPDRITDFATEFPKLNVHMVGLSKETTSFLFEKMHEMHYPPTHQPFVGDKRQYGFELCSAYSTIKDEARPTTCFIRAIPKLTDAEIPLLPEGNRHLMDAQLTEEEGPYMGTHYKDAIIEGFSNVKRRENGQYEFFPFDDSVPSFTFTDTQGRFNVDGSNVSLQILDPLQDQLILSLVRILLDMSIEPFESECIRLESSSKSSRIKNTVPPGL